MVAGVGAPAQAGLGVLMEKYPVIWVTSLFDAQGWNISAERHCVSSHARSGAATAAEPLATCSAETPTTCSR